MGWANKVKNQHVAWHWKLTVTQLQKYGGGTDLWQAMERLKAVGWRCHLETYPKTGSQWLLAWPPGEKLYRMSEEQEDHFYVSLRQALDPTWKPYEQRRVGG
jgi:hypothetical protein